MHRRLANGDLVEKQCTTCQGWPPIDTGRTIHADTVGWTPRWCSPCLPWSSSSSSDPMPQATRAAACRCTAVCIAAALAVVLCNGSQRDLDPLVRLMTLEEKIRLVHGQPLVPWTECAYTGKTRNISRLGVPEMRENDGPQGFR